jgi:DGQHR domain-containing protein
MLEKLTYIEPFKCLKIDQPIGTFYVGTIDSSDLIDISYADIRTIEQERRDIETYLGIQRPLSPNRVKEIEKYVNLVDASFPTSIILAIESVNVNINEGEQDEEQPPIFNVIFDESRSEMQILKNPKVAKIIDGQHRIAGLRKYEGSRNSFQLNVAIFIDMDIEDQAMVFATINEKHTKVNKSLVADLFEFGKSRSPQKTCNFIVRLLNGEKDSPFYDKIKILGVADNKLKETITQATFAKNILNYMSKDPMIDRDRIKRGKSIDKAKGSEAQRYFLRNLFIDKKDADIARIIWNYFSAVQKRWPGAWDNVESEMILNKSTGFIALMRFFKDAYIFIKKNFIGEVATTDEFYKIFKRIGIGETEFNRKKYLPGSGGQGTLYKDLLKQSGIGEGK